MKRKIHSEKKKSFFGSPKFFTMLIGLFIVLIMAGSALNMWGEEEETDSYDFGEIKFTNIGYGWQAKKGTESFFMLNDPRELANLTVPYVDFSILESFEKIYLSINPNDNPQQAISLLKENIRPIAGTVPACYTDVPECRDMPLKNCSDAKEGIGVVVLRKANETELSFNGNCLIIQGKNLLKVIDRAIMEYYTTKWA